MDRPTLLALDIDGTITTPDKEKVLHKALMQTLTQFTSTGVLCTFVTGRGFFRVKERIQDTFIPNCPMIIENGSRLTTWDGNDIQTFSFSDENIDSLVPLFQKKYAKGIDFFGTDQKHNALILDESLKKVGGLFRDFLPEEQIHAHVTDVNEFATNAKTLGCFTIVFLFDTGIDAIPFPDGIEKTKNGAHIIVNPKEVSKASGLRALMAHTKTLRKNVLIAGNDHNDIEMFRLDLGWKIAVGDAPKELLQNATHCVANAEELNALLQKICNI